MESIARLALLHSEEQAARQRYADLRDRRAALLAHGRDCGLTGAQLAKAAHLTPSRVYKVASSAVDDPAVTLDAADADLTPEQIESTLSSVTKDMTREQAAAEALARQRTSVAVSLYRDGASAPFLAKLIGANVESVRNWLYDPRGAN